MTKKMGKFWFSTFRLLFGRRPQFWSIVVNARAPCTGSGVPAAGFALPVAKPEYFKVNKYGSAVQVGITA